MAELEALLDGKNAEIERLKAALTRIMRTGGAAIAIKFIHDIARKALEGKDD